MPSMNKENHCTPLDSLEIWMGEDSIVAGGFHPSTHPSEGFRGSTPNVFSLTCRHPTPESRPDHIMTCNLNEASLILEP